MEGFNLMLQGKLIGLFAVEKNDLKQKYASKFITNLKKIIMMLL